MDGSRVMGIKSLTDWMRRRARWSALGFEGEPPRITHFENFEWQVNSWAGSPVPALQSKIIQ